MAEYVSTVYQLVEYRYNGTHYSRARCSVSVSTGEHRPIDCFRRTYEDNIPLEALTVLRKKWREKWALPERQTVVVSRHKALVEYLVSIGMVHKDTPILGHVMVDEIRGKHVIGNLPLHLAAEAETVTEIPLPVPLKLRGAELTLEQIRQFAKPPTRYVVRLDNRKEEAHAKF